MNLSQLNRVLLQTLLLPVLALSVLSGVFVWQIVSAVHTVDHIQMADRGITMATDINAGIVNEETGLRGYQVTGNTIFLQPYVYAQSPLHQQFQQLRDSIAAQHGDVSQVDRLVAAHDQWQIAVAQPLIQATENGIDTRGTSTNLRGKARMDTIRDRIAEINTAQRGVRDRAVDRFHDTVRHTIEVAIGLALIIGLMIGVYSRGQLRSVSAAFERTLGAVWRNAQEIHASEDRLRTILRSLGEAVVVCNAQGQIEILNTVAQEMTGWPEAEAIKRPVDQVILFVSADDQSAIAPPVRSALAGQVHVTVHGNTRLVRRNGSEVFAEGLAVPVIDDAGKVAGAVMVFRDVTEQRQTQAALLASEKLAVAGRLAATIAHEIHNPLDAAINLLYLLSNHPSEEETDEFLALASGELDRVAKISRAMLGMYRESKTPVELDLVALMRSLLLLLERNLVQAEVSVEASFDEEPALVTGYPAELRQVFTNLLTNALDASAPHTKITVSIARDAGGATVTIRDQGEGIPQDTIPLLFQPFFTTKGERGTGLGLWVSHGIIEKHAGSIRVETETDGPEHGTTMIVSLPKGDSV